MQSIGSILTLIILVAVFVGGGTYYFTDQKLTKQKDDLTKEIKDLRSKTSQIEQTASKTASELEAAKTAAPATASNPTPSPTTPPAEAAQSQAAAPIDITKWKLYSSPNYDYTVKYPSDWDYKDTTSGVAMNTISFKPKTVKDSYAFSVVVEKSSLDYSISLIKKQLSESYTYKSKTTADLSGTTFTILTFESKATSTIKPVVYLAQIDDYVYHFSAADNADAAINASTAEMAKNFTVTKQAASTETKPAQ